MSDIYVGLCWTSLDGIRRRRTLASQITASTSRVLAYRNDTARSNATAARGNERRDGEELCMLASISIWLADAPWPLSLSRSLALDIRAIDRMARRLH